MQHKTVVNGLSLTLHATRNTHSSTRAQCGRQALKALLLAVGCTLLIEFIEFNCIMSASSPAVDFPIEGAPFHFLREFIDANGGEAAFQGLTTDDVKDRFIVPQTQATKLSLFAQMKQAGDARIQPATWFVSHAWKYKFLDLVKALEAFFADKGGVVIIWLDLFSTSQHSTFSKPPEWWQQTFVTAIGRMGQMVMVMTPWDNPICLTRAWCLIELFACRSSGSRFGVAFPPAERARFLETITERSAAFYDMLG